MAFSVQKRDLRDDELTAVLDRCGRAAGLLAVSAMGIAVVYFTALFLLSR